MPKVELAFDIWEDGFLRVKGQVVEYDERLTAEKIKDGHFLRHPDTPARINSALYSLGCVPTPPQEKAMPVEGKITDKGQHKK